MGECRPHGVESCEDCYVDALCPTPPERFCMLCGIREGFGHSPRCSVTKFGVKERFFVRPAAGWDELLARFRDLEAENDRLREALEEAASYAQEIVVCLIPLSQDGADRAEQWAQRISALAVTDPTNQKDRP